MKIVSRYISFILMLSQGDGNIRYFEITTEKPYIQYLMEFRSPAPQKGLGKLIFPAKKTNLHYLTVLYLYENAAEPQCCSTVELNKDQLH